MNKLTQKSQEALQAAQVSAQEYSHQELDAPHLALALARQSDTIVPTLLQRIGVDLSALEGDMEAELDCRAKVAEVSASNIFLGRDLKQAFDKAEDEAKKLGDEYLSAEHLLLGLLEGGSALKKICAKHHINRPVLLENIAVTGTPSEAANEIYTRYGSIASRIANSLTVIASGISTFLLTAL